MCKCQYGNYTSGRCFDVKRHENSLHDNDIGMCEYCGDEKCKCQYCDYQCSLKSEMEKNVN